VPPGGRAAIADRDIGVARTSALGSFEERAQLQAMSMGAAGRPQERVRAVT
jgi:hypothetical protein